MVRKLSIACVIVTIILSVVAAVVYLRRESPDRTPTPLEMAMQAEKPEITELPSQDPPAMATMHMKGPPLTAGQRAALERIDAETMRAMNALMQKRNLTPAERQRQARLLQKQRDRRIKETLSKNR